MTYYLLLTTQARSAALEKFRQRVCATTQPGGSRLATASGSAVAAAGGRTVDRTGDRVADRTGDRTVDRTGDRVADRTGDRMGDRTGDRMGDRTGDRTSISERPNEDLSEDPNEDPSRDLALHDALSRDLEREELLLATGPHDSSKERPPSCRIYSASSFGMQPAGQILAMAFAMSSPCVWPALPSTLPYLTHPLRACIRCRSCQSWAGVCGRRAKWAVCVSSGSCFRIQ